MAGGDRAVNSDNPVDRQWRGHTPVMAQEVLDVFASVPPGVLVDATLGGGGHAAALLEAHPDCSLIGIDQDREALRAATGHLERFGARARTHHARFDALGDVLDQMGIDSIVGILFDLGVSSHQLDAGWRGFSYRKTGPLDMRMNTNMDHTADVLVNQVEVGELARVLRAFGDERHASRIAAAIVAARPVADTAELAEIVRTAIPAPARRRGGHPAKRTFQALRIAVNQELDVLERAIGHAIDRLVPGGLGAVLTYHSGEDRIVKQLLRIAAAEGEDRPGPRGRPAPAQGSAPIVRLVHRRGVTPSADEIEDNPRAASARLRAFEKLETAA